ncbi:MAG: hypothetical protein QXR61_03275 [Candidatus Bathyarchaeia archaeon]
MMKIDLLSLWHHYFFRKRIRVVAECQHCRYGLTEADLEEGKCPSCGMPIRKKGGVRQSDG